MSAHDDGGVVTALRPPRTAKEFRRIDGGQVDRAHIQHSYKRANLEHAHKRNHVAAKHTLRLRFLVMMGRNK